MRTILWFIRAAAYLMGADSKMRRARALRDRGEEAAFRSMLNENVTDFALTMLKNAGVTTDVYGTENLPEEPVLYVCNHESDWDIALVLAYLDAPHGLVSKEQLAKVPFAKDWMDLLGCLFIQREDLRGSIRVLDQMGQAVRDGHSMIIFPEGQRSRTDAVQNFGSGAFRSALKYKLPIVPVAILGTHRIMEANNGKWIRPAHVSMKILPMIRTGAMDRSEQKAIARSIQQQIVDAREEMRSESPENAENILG